MKEPKQPQVKTLNFVVSVLLLELSFFWITLLFKVTSVLVLAFRIRVRDGSSVSQTLGFSETLLVLIAHRFERAGVLVCLNIFLLNNPKKSSLRQ